MARPRTERERLCDTEDVSDPRYREARSRGPFASTDVETAVFGGRRNDPHLGPAIARATVDSWRSARRRVVRVGELPGAVDAPKVERSETTFGGGTAGAGARGGRRRLGEEVR